MKLLEERVKKLLWDTEDHKRKTSWRINYIWITETSWDKISM